MENGGKKKVLDLDSKTKKAGLKGIGEVEDFNNYKQIMMHSNVRRMSCTVRKFINLPVRLKRMTRRLFQSAIYFKG